MKLKKLICGILAMAALIFLLGTAGASDLGLIDTTEIAVRGILGLAVFIGGLRIGEFIW